MRLFFGIVFGILGIIPGPAFGQAPATAEPPSFGNAPNGVPITPVVPPGGMPGPFSDAPAAEYRIGPDDLLDVNVFEIDVLDAEVRVSGAGYINLPLVGPVEAAGLTEVELSGKIAEALRQNYVRDPQVTVFVREYASQPVSIVGPVTQPGIYQIQGQKRLLDMLAMAGGLREDAGASIMIFRNVAPQAASEAGPAAQPLTVINIEDLTERGNTALNVPVYAGDTINVLQAGVVTVAGEVNSPGMYVLRNGRSLTVAEALARGGGPTPDAKLSASYLVRVHVDGAHEEIPVDIEKVYDGEAEDVAMLPNDILFVESSTAKPALRRALDAAIAVASGMLIYGGR
jgi:polysaccharide export outer membrane protein